MSTVLFIKNMIMSFFQFMYLRDEEQIECGMDTDAEVSVTGVLKSMIEIVICVGVCFCIFVIPVYIKML